MEAAYNASQFANKSYDDLSLLAKSSLKLTYFIYDNHVISSYVPRDYVKYLPSLFLSLFSISLVTIGCFASAKKPTNAQPANIDHPLYDQSDSTLDLDETFESVHKLDTKSALLLPCFAGALLTALNYGFKNSLEVIIQKVYDNLMIPLTFTSLYETLCYVIYTTNRKFCHAFGLHTTKFFKRRRITISSDPVCRPSGLYSVDEFSSKSRKVQNLKIKIFSTVEQEDQSTTLYFSDIELLSMVLAGALNYGYFQYSGSKNWILANLAACCYSIQGIKAVSVTSFKVGVLLLSLMFFYDIYFVFFSDAMVNVAVSLDVPVKLQFPQLPQVSHALAQEINKVPLLKSSIVGLGDIALPGSFIALLLQFDLFLHYEKNPGAQYYHAENFSKTYFTAGVVGYALGLTVTNVCLYVYNQAQPALLYLVPSIFLTTILTALFKGELKKLWSFENQKKPEEDKKIENGFLSMEFPEDDEADVTYEVEEVEVLVEENEEESDESEDDDIEEEYVVEDTDEEEDDADGWNRTV